jgi:hypothetical protein
VNVVEPENKAFVAHFINYSNLIETLITGDNLESRMSNKVNKINLKLYSKNIIKYK